MGVVSNSEINPRFAEGFASSFSALQNVMRAATSYQGALRTILHRFMMHRLLTVRSLARELQACFWNRL